MLTWTLGVAGSFSAVAQNGGAYSEIAGKVVDDKSGQELSYASVTLSGSNISNVSNSDGFFTLKIPANFALSSYSVVKVSFVGYSSESIPVSEFSGSSQDKPLTVRLKRVALTLEASMIKPYDAESLFDEAFARVKQNYSDQNVSMTGFYREKITKGSKYLAMNEAVVDILKVPYTSYKDDRIGIFKGRGSQNYDSSDTLFIKFQGGPVSAVEADVVKNPFLGVYMNEIHTYYDMWLSERVTMNGRTFFVISFDQKKYYSKDIILYRGNIYIDTETYAIGRIDCFGNVEDNEKAVGMFIKSKPADTKISVDLAHYTVNYKMAGDGKWYLDYDNLELKFTTKKKRSLWRNHFTIVSEMAVTDHKPGTFEITPESRLKYRDVLSEKVSSFTDADFWGGYNIIEPDKSIDKITEKIVKQLKKREAEK